jgi:acetoin utilization deacetylase AcuC-like enzyme
VHHGNGTQNVFYERREVYFLSFHEWPLYPGTGREAETGAGAGLGKTRNVALAPYTPEENYLERFFAVVGEVHKEFKPDFILISAGFDAHHHDPLAHLRLTESGFARMTEFVLDLAKLSCQGKVVSLLEGGYHLEGLARSVAAHVEKLHAASA